MFRKSVISGLPGVLFRGLPFEFVLSFEILTDVLNACLEGYVAKNPGPEDQFFMDRIYGRKD
jgi:hypothetical protein